MKKVFSILLVAFAMSAIVASCEKENVGNGNHTDSVPNDTTGTGGIPGGVVTSPQWVDLGLPSGLLWATCNVGATAPEKYGDYFAWGETQTKSVYNCSTYRYCNGYMNYLTKYCTDTNSGYYGFIDNLTTLVPADDAATVLGNGARTPTKAEWEELINKTTATWTTVNGVAGCKLTSNNGKSIFLPAAGSAGVGGAGDYGFYWSSSLNTDLPCFAWIFYFVSDGQEMSNKTFRYYGLSVRAVKNAN